jgi:hypothetical protein
VLQLDTNRRIGPPQLLARRAKVRALIRSCLRRLSPIERAVRACATRRQRDRATLLNGIGNALPRVRPRSRQSAACGLDDAWRQAHFSLPEVHLWPEDLLHGTSPASVLVAERQGPVQVGWHCSAEALEVPPLKSLKWLRLPLHREVRQELPAPRHLPSCALGGSDSFSKRNLGGDDPWIVHAFY